MRSLFNTALLAMIAAWIVTAPMVHAQEIQRESRIRVIRAKEADSSSAGPSRVSPPTAGKKARIVVRREHKHPGSPEYRHLFFLTRRDGEKKADAKKARVRAIVIDNDGKRKEIQLQADGLKLPSGLMHDHEGKKRQAIRLYGLRSDDAKALQQLRILMVDEPVDGRPKLAKEKPEGKKAKRKRKKGKRRKGRKRNRKGSKGKRKGKNQGQTDRRETTTEEVRERVIEATKDIPLRITRLSPSKSAIAAPKDNRIQLIEKKLAQLQKQIQAISRKLDE